MSAGPLSPRARVFKWGGKRDRQARVSFALSDHEVRRLFAAIRAASAAGLPLTRFVTIHWELQGVPHGQGGNATSALLDKVRRAMVKRGLRFAYVWSRETGLVGKGDHVHILWHVKPYAGFPQAMQRWIEEIAGKPYRRGVLKTETIGRSLEAHRTAPEAFEANLATLAAYILKGASQRTAEALKLGVWGKGGRVIGQRSGMSRNLARLISGRNPGLLDKGASRPGNRSGRWNRH